MYVDVLCDSVSILYSLMECSWILDITADGNAWPEWKSKSTPNELMILFLVINHIITIRQMLPLTNLIVVIDENKQFEGMKKNALLSTVAIITVLLRSALKHCKAFMSWSNVYIHLAYDNSMLYKQYITVSDITNTNFVK